MNASASAWERMWAPYAEDDYRRVLAFLRPADVVLEIGAGDLRLARRMAVVTRRLFAVEIDPARLWEGLESGPLPANLCAACADALSLPIPAGVTVGVLMMRHCLHYADYASRLRQAGAARLITNARWGMGVECVELQTPPLPYAAAPVGWYACGCGAAGFKPGPVESWSGADQPLEVCTCPRCE